MQPLLVLEIVADIADPEIVRSGVYVALASLRKIGLAKPCLPLAGLIG